MTWWQVETKAQEEHESLNHKKEPARNSLWNMLSWNLLPHWDTIQTVLQNGVPRLPMKDQFLLPCCTKIRHKSAHCQSLLRRKHWCPTPLLKLCHWDIKQAYSQKKPKKPRCQAAPRKESSLLFPYWSQEQVLQRVTALPLNSLLWTDFNRLAPRYSWNWHKLIGCKKQEKKHEDVEINCSQNPNQNTGIKFFVDLNEFDTCLMIFIMSVYIIYKPCRHFRKKKTCIKNMNDKCRFDTFNLTNDANVTICKCNCFHAGHK